MRARTRVCTRHDRALAKGRDRRLKRKRVSDHLQDTLLSIIRQTMCEIRLTRAYNIHEYIKLDKTRRRRRRTVVS